MMFGIDLNLVEVLRDEFNVKPYVWIELVDRIGVEEYNDLFRLVVRNRSKGEYKILFIEIIRRLDKVGALSEEYKGLKKYLG